MREPKPLSAAHKAKIAAGMRDYHRKCHNGGAHVPNPEPKPKYKSKGN